LRSFSFSRYDDDESPTDEATTTRGAAARGGRGPPPLLHDERRWSPMNTGSKIRRSSSRRDEPPVEATDDLTPSSWLFLIIPDSLVLLHFAWLVERATRTQQCEALAPDGPPAQGGSTSLPRWMDGAACVRAAETPRRPGVLRCARIASASSSSSRRRRERAGSSVSPTVTGRRQGHKQQNQQQQQQQQQRQQQQQQGSRANARYRRQGWKRLDDGLREASRDGLLLPALSVPC
jgi:hypothetical protein